MKPNIWKKQPWEMRVLLVNCSNALPDGVTISTLTVEVYDSDGVDVTTDMIDTSSIDGSNALITVKAGTDKESYDMKIKLTLSNSEKVEDDMKIKVREVGQ